MRQYELISFEENHGIAYARNYALHHATTKYLIFIDSDDLPLPQLLEKEYNLLKNDQELMAVILGCHLLTQKVTSLEVAYL